MSIRQRASIASIAATCICGAASASVTQADYAPCGSTEGIASFLAHVTYAYSGGPAASISIQLDNDTSMMLGGYVTAIAINPAAGATGLSFVSCSNTNFSGLAGTFVAPPYGTFAAGASTGGGWTGGGSPLGGIAAGSSALFVFSLTGSAAYLGSLTAENVLGGAGNAMAIRFRGGAGNDWSDKVIGCALPAPGAVSLLGVVGLLGARRRR